MTIGFDSIKGRGNERTAGCRLLPQNLGNSRLSRIVDDRRFAEAVYKVALAGSVLDRMGYLDIPDRL
jgi:hypothetical protein